MKHFFGRMAAQIGLRHVEDQPAFARVGEREPKLVANECTQLLGPGRIQ